MFVFPSSTTSVVPEYVVFDNVLTTLAFNSLSDKEQGDLKSNRLVLEGMYTERLKAANEGFFESAEVTPQMVKEAKRLAKKEGFVGLLSKFNV